MKRKTDRHGNLIRAYQSGDGMRRRYYDTLDERRFSFPRTLPRKHGLPWYLDGHMADRPVYGLYALGRVAEHMLNRARTGTPAQKRSFPIVARFFASTRRAMQNVISTYGVNGRLYPEESDRVRSTYMELTAEAIRAYEAMKAESKPEVSAFGRMGPSDRELLEAILLQQSQEGVIPRTSVLYREVKIK